jgi:outer membrane protein OmpA-like peptidoglycan-associated protein
VRNKLGLVVLGAALIGLAGCSYVPDAVNPISWYRDATGASKNDDLGKGQNEQNLAEGGNEPYPNLGTVPNPPDTQLSTVDRNKLVSSLVADRNNAQYTADNLRAGEVASTVPPPAPPAAATPTTKANNLTVGQASSAPPPAASATPAPPPASAPSSSAALAPPAAPASAPSRVASASPSPIPSASSRGASTPATGTGTAANGPSGLHKPPPRGSAPPPPESSLQSPTIPNVPQGEAASPPPPPPHITPPNQTAAATPSSGAAAVPSAPPQNTAAPAKPVVALKPPPSTPMQQATAPATAPALHRPAISYRVAEVSFTKGSALISDGTHNAIAEIVKLHTDEGGTIRIVGHGEAAGKDAAIAGFTLALDRAEAVAVALTDAGVPAKDIAVEAAPVAARGGADAPRAEVYLEH